MTKDLTTGSPMKLMFSFGFPLLLGFLFQQLYNLVDTAIVGKTLGGEALAAVGATGSINFLVVGLSAASAAALPFRWPSSSAPAIPRSCAASSPARCGCVWPLGWSSPCPPLHDM